MTGLLLGCVVAAVVGVAMTFHQAWLQETSPRSAIRDEHLWLAAALFLAFLQGVVVGFVLAVKMLGVG